ncbi:MAG TPA: tRNA uridine-5-carboxymethylaminomethyl(34) synthesis GTPase MnmE [Opitutaceae bacterium]|nr:tRNA uridine-5-carboxymethylaminomethyl(34) synthesis GTPase MnmE [Opitutaceae bacterium]
MSPGSDMIAALATPSGESAIALIRVSGPGARAIAAEILGRDPVPRFATRAELRDMKGAILDDTIITFFEGPNSYTGEDVVEISGHGNPMIARRILENLCSRGCRVAEPGEFTRRAFMNGRMDLSQAEAVMDLIRARGDRAIEAANRQLRGALGRQVSSLSDTLLGAIARVEAYIDFPEEDLPTDDRDLLCKLIESVLKPMSALLATGRYGELLRAGVRTVIVGEPNAGKSSLLNRLLGWERAIVSATPGTTRDFLEEPRIIGGHCIRLTDTAGLSRTPGEIEGLGIARTLDLVAGADLILLVVDSSLPFPALGVELFAAVSPLNTVVVWNKSDLSPPRVTPPPFRDSRSVSVCALDGSGFGHLESAISDFVELHRKDPGPELIAINARHALDLADSRECLERALSKVEIGQSDEMLAADLRCALDCLGRIGGRIDNEQMLDKLFAEFCIGK